jgi:hypothetical protein
LPQSLKIWALGKADMVGASWQPLAMLLMASCSARQGLHQIPPKSRLQQHKIAIFPGGKHEIFMAARIDFFISYTGRDLPWAEWVDARLRDPGYSTIVQFADFRPGQNIIHRMQTALATANQVIGILSPRYLESPFTTAEWTAAVRDDPLGEKRRLLLVRVGAHRAHRPSS